MKVILLAAGAGRRFGARTRALPKCLIPLGGQTLLSRYLDSFRALGLKEIVVVVGHEKEKIEKACRTGGKGLSIRFLFNPHYREGSVVSLHRAADELDTGCLIMDADVFFETTSLKRLLAFPSPTAFLIDPQSKSTGEEMMLMAGDDNRPTRISKKIDKNLKILGEAVGFFKIGALDAWSLRKILRDFISRGRTRIEYEETYNALMRNTKVGCEKITGFWTEMDFEEDLKKIICHCER